MAERSNRSRTERLKYGMCLNDECPKCTSKEIQGIPMRRDFVCAECGKELRECRPPKKKSNGKLYAGIAALAIIAAAGGSFYFCGNGTEEQSQLVAPADSDSVKVVVKEDTVPVNETKVKSDTIVNNTQTSDVKVDGSKVVKTTVTTSETTITTNSSTKTSSKVEPKVKSQPTTSSGKSSLNLSYGKYTGEVKGGYPHGMGRLTYTKSRQINRYDQKARQANPGDYVIGEFVNGFLVQGKHYNAQGELIESLIVGVAADGAYESK